MPLEHHASALRNRGPILEVMQKLFPTGLEGDALEVACGSGAHIEVFAPVFPNLTWQPTEFDESRIPQLNEHFRDVPNVKEARFLDASKSPEEWGAPVGTLSLIFVCNMTHISPIEATLGLIAGARALLKPGGSLVVYGPFKVNNEFTTQSNDDFDKDLKRRNPLWGYRDIKELQTPAEACGLVMDAPREMPANNFLLRFTKQA